ncbi:hypothetical protein SBA3_4550004 [Candidatus Sulfopaludibacter sp. SbA3]|nr:hypothetical protein SBA3_4550004 [Candidatus Sulfopaludibacter sp. SbA3]
MEPFEHDELSEQELDDLLNQWTSPAAPPHLRAALFPPAPGSWWRRMWTVSIRVPLPVACCLALLLAAAAWRAAQPAPPAFKPTVVSTPAHDLTFNELRPVVELRPRIIRRENGKN